MNLLITQRPAAPWWLAAIISAGLALGASIAQAETGAAPSGADELSALARLEGGEYRPLYAKAAEKRLVKPFWLGRTQVTNGEFLDFVRAHPQWRRSQVARSQADANYLNHWAGDLDLGPQAKTLRDAPVTHVSWFAARAFCAARGRRLPTQDEWEFAARADATRADASGDPAFLRRMLEWYSRPASGPLPAAKDAEITVHGVRGLHGLVWEWVEDFNSAMIVGDSRSDGSRESRLFCGAASLLSADVNNYAAYMRYALRSSLRGDYCVGSLGFRAARSEEPEAARTPAPAVGESTATSIYDIGGTWQSQKDRPMSLKALRGRIRVVTLGFTFCPYACPRIVGDLQRIEAALGADADKVGFVFISIDPKRDTPAQLNEFAEARKLDPKRWLLLRGESDRIQEVAVSLGFKYQPVEEDFAHTNLIAVVDADGRIIHREEALGAEIAPAVAVIRDLMAKPAVATP